MKRIFCLFILSAIFSLGADAQTDVKILDMSLSSQAVGQDSVELAVNFKINKSNKAAKVYLLLGTAENKSDVFSAEAIFTGSATTRSIVYKGGSYPVQLIQAGFKVKISNQQYSSYSVATLFVETTTGEYTTRLFSTK